MVLFRVVPHTFAAGLSKRMASGNQQLPKFEDPKWSQKGCVSPSNDKQTNAATVLLEIR